MPPKQGQSQSISPVSGLKADRCSSSAAAAESEEEEEGIVRRASSAAAISGSGVRGVALEMVLSSSAKSTISFRHCVPQVQG